MTISQPGRRSFNVAQTDAGERLDRFLHIKAPELSRSRFKDLIKQGHVSLGGGTITEPNRRVKPGETVEIDMPPPEDPIPKPEDIPLTILFEDDDIIVIDKPPGLVVHPAAGNWSGTLVNALIAHCGASLSGIGGVRRPGIVHRLDKDTSGVMVAAKNDQAHAALSRQFQAHGRDGKLERAYLALIWGRPRLVKDTIDTQIARKHADRKKMTVIRDGGRQAITHYEILSGHPPGKTPVVSLVKCYLETGRTHQIRVHMAHLGHPVLGDASYGAGFKASAAKLGREAQKRLERLGRQALHAAILGFEHPITKQKMRFETPLPSDFQRLIDAIDNA